MHTKITRFIFKLLPIILLFFWLLLSNQLCQADTYLKYKSNALHNNKEKSLKQARKRKTPDSHVKKQILNAEEDDASAPWSSAFNFSKQWGVQVDPRTGTLATYIKVGSLLSNVGHGPDIILNANYNSNAIANPDGLGQGWSWNLTHFNPLTNQLTTATGQSFYLQKTKTGQWQPLYYKLKDVLIQGDKANHFVITYANGLRETLNHDGYEIRLEQQNGWGVNFTYAANSNLLTAITDDEGHQIALARHESMLTVTSYDTDGKPVHVLIDIANDRVNDITLPLQYGKTEPHLHLKYNIRHLLTETDYPTGLEEKLSYNCTDAMRLPLPNRPEGTTMCVIASKTVIPGNTEQPVVTRYHYSRANSNGHNYLAFNSGLSFVSGTKRDILFEAPTDYTYRTQEDSGLIKDIRTYNKYHLLIDDKKVSDSSGDILTEEQNFYCHADEVDGCANTSFKDLPATYSLPLKTVAKVWGKNSVIPAVNTITKYYDQQGRIVRVTDDYGITTYTTYCPASGDAACPAAPEGWPVNHLPESVTVYPAKDSKGLLPLTTRNYYHKLANFTGTGYTLVLDHKVYAAGDQQRIVKRLYYEDKSDYFNYGLLKQLVLTGTTQKNATLTSVVSHYYYMHSRDGSRRTTYSTTEIGNGRFKRSSSVTTSLFTNQALKVTDPSGVNIIRYHYDLFGRLVQTDSAVGTSFSVSTHYQYVVSPKLNQVLVTTPTGLQSKIVFDHAGHKWMTFAEAIDKSGKAEPGHWLLKSKNIHDRYGRLTDQQTYITSNAGKQQTFNTTGEYDEMGRIRRIHLADKISHINLYDDADHCQMSYQQNERGEYSTISVVRTNKLNKPILEVTLPASQKSLPTTKVLCENARTQPGAKVTTITYDGFGRVNTVTDPGGRTITKHYDAAGQVTDVINPVGDRMHKVFNLTGKVIENRALPHNGSNYLLSAARYNAVGELLWQSDENGEKTTYTYTANGQLSTETTPSGHIVSWEYNVLGLPTVKRLDGKVLLQTKYNPITRAPEWEQDNTGITYWYYTDDGLPKLLIHKGKESYPDYQLQWQYDINRRIVSVTDISGNKTLTFYDTLGRMAALYYQRKNESADTLLYAPVYDDFARVSKIRYGSGMQRTIAYDSYDHPYQISDTLENSLISQWDYTFDINNNITSVQQHTGTGGQGVLDYHYDALDNLVTMHCHGSAGLPLCPRDTDFSATDLNNAPVIVQQDYTFTPLNQLARVKETLQRLQSQKTLNKVMTYRYNGQLSPLRLQTISTQWDNHTPKTMHFMYDASGNMTTDGQGDQIQYNAFNQISAVTTPGGVHSYYDYDGNSREAMEHNKENTSYLFYRGNSDQLINETISSIGQTTHTIGYKGVAKTIDGIIDQYYEQNYKGDVVGVITQDKQSKGQYKLSQRNIYSPYGMSWHKPSPVLPLYQQFLLGFDGERTDPATGWQFLGAGHRTYNPAQRYFVTEDPATGGYGFGSNNPIMNSDPSGNMPKWLGTTAKVLGYIGTLGFSAIPEKWAHITGSVVSGGLFVATMGLAFASYGSSAAFAAMAAAAVPASIPVAAASAPPNKGLNIAAAVAGGIAFTAGIATGLFMLGFGPGGCLNIDYTIDFSDSSFEESVGAAPQSVAAISQPVTESTEETVQEAPPSPERLEPIGAEPERTEPEGEAAGQVNGPTQSITSDEEEAIPVVNLNRPFTQADVHIAETFVRDTNRDLEQPLFVSLLPERGAGINQEFSLVLNDFWFSRAVTFADGQDAPLYDIELDRAELRRLLLGDHMWLQRAAPITMEDINFESWYAVNNYDRLFNELIPRFHKNVQIFRERFGYYGPIFRYGHMMGRSQYARPFINFFSDLSNSRWFA